MKRKRLTLSKKRNCIGLLFVLPWIAGFLIFFLYPLFQSVVFSMSSVVITAKGRRMEAAGMQNFIHLFTVDPLFTGRLAEFLKELALELPLIVVFSLILAMLLNQRIRCRGLFRTLFFLPVIVVSGPVLNMLMGTGTAAIPLIEQYGVYDVIAGYLPAFLQAPVRTLCTQLLLILWYSGVPTLIFSQDCRKSMPLFSRPLIWTGLRPGCVFGRLCCRPSGG